MGLPDRKDNHPRPSPGWKALMEIEALVSKLIAILKLSDRFILFGNLTFFPIYSGEIYHGSVSLRLADQSIWLGWISSLLGVRFFSVEEVASCSYVLFYPCSTWTLHEELVVDYVEWLARFRGSWLPSISPRHAGKIECYELHPAWMT